MNINEVKSSDKCMHTMRLAYYYESTVELFKGTEIKEFMKKGGLAYKLVEVTKDKLEKGIYKDSDTFVRFVADLKVESLVKVMLEEALTKYPDTIWQAIYIKPEISSKKKSQNVIPMSKLKESDEFIFMKKLNKKGITDVECFEYNQLNKYLSMDGDVYKAVLIQHDEAYKEIVSGKIHEDSIYVRFVKENSITVMSNDTLDVVCEDYRVVTMCKIIKVIGKVTHVKTAKKSKKKLVFKY